MLSTDELTDLPRVGEDKKLIEQTMSHRTDVLFPEQRAEKCLMVQRGSWFQEDPNLIFSM